MKLFILYIISTLLLTTQNIQCSKILALFNVPAHSHHLWNLVYLKALLKRGHQITYVGVDEYKNPPENLTYIHIEHQYDNYVEMDFTDISSLSKYESLFHLYSWYDFVREGSQNEDGYKKFLNVVKNEKFDLVLFDLGGSPFLLGAVDALGRPPVMGITAFGVPGWSMDYSGTPYPVQNDPFFLLPFPKDMTYFQRLENGFFFTVAWLLRRSFLANEEIASKKSFGSHIRSLDEIVGDISINVVNHNKATDNPYPSTPGLIQIAGVHISEPKPLPQDLKTFLDSSTEGVVYFSLGSNVQSSFLHEKEIAILNEAFKQLAPVKVVWKWEKDELPGKPDNVKIGKWLPQNDILSHPNVRLFFTHGGMLSSHEAIYHGVPIVGMPIFLDQHVNTKKASILGYGEIISLKGLTSNTVVNAIKKVLQNPSYKTTAQKMSKIFKDNIVPPLDEAVYWTEYAIRHNGAKHLRPASKNLNWFQAGLYDLLLTVLAVPLIIIFIAFKIIKKLVSKPKQKVKKQ